MKTKLSEMTMILKRLADAYGQRVTEDQVRAYHMVLGQYPRMVLVTVSAMALREIKFFPRVAELVAIAERVHPNYRQPAWAAVDEAMFWYLYRHNMASTDELNEADVAKIYREAGETLAVAI